MCYGNDKEHIYTYHLHIIYASTKKQPCILPPASNEPEGTLHAKPGSRSMRRCIRRWVDTVLHMSHLTNRAHYFTVVQRGWWHRNLQESVWNHATKDDFCDTTSRIKCRKRAHSSHTRATNKSCSNKHLEEDEKETYTYSGKGEIKRYTNGSREKTRTYDAHAHIGPRSACIYRGVHLCSLPLREP